MFRSGVFFWLLVPYLLSILTISLPSIFWSFVWCIGLIYTCFYGESATYLFSRIYDLGLMLKPVDLHVWFILFLPDGRCLSIAISILEVFLFMGELIWILKHERRSWDFFFPSLLRTMYLVHAAMFFWNQACTCISFLSVMNAVYLQVHSFSLVDVERDYLSLDKWYPRLCVPWIFKT